MPANRKIKGRMVELGLTQKELAKLMNIAPATLSQKLNGIRPMYLEEAQTLSKLLQIDDSMLGSYFFDP